MATSIIKLHAFSCAGDGGAPCYILQVDEFHCLLDCGLSEDVDSQYVVNISKWAKHIDAVLLSHQSLWHIGLLPYLVGNCGLKCPIYATTPVYKMGQLSLYDFYQSKYASENFSLFTLDDIDAAFDLVTQLKYQETVNLHGRGRGLCVTPLPSGHTLGGTIWKLVKEDTDIVYAVDFNHKKDRHLNGATFDACMRPHLLILDSSNALYSHPRRKDRDENLRQCILKSLRRGGNVLVAVDTAGRCLEVAHYLEQCWLNQDSGMMAYGLAMLNYVTFNVVDFARSMVEWMSEKVMRTFEDQRSNPFHFRHMQLCHSLEQLDAVPEPKVVLASASDLSCGFARQLFAEWADNDLNTVILTSRELCSSRSQASGQENGYDLLNRLIALAKGDPEAREGLPKSSTGTLVLPMTLSQRVSAAHFERLENELPRIRNAVTPGSRRDSTSRTDFDVPMEGETSAPGVTPNGESQPSPADLESNVTQTQSLPVSFDELNTPTSTMAAVSEPEAPTKSTVVITSTVTHTDPAHENSSGADHLDHDPGVPLSVVTKVLHPQPAHHEISPLGVGSRLTLQHHQLGAIGQSGTATQNVHNSETSPAATGTIQLTAGRHQPGYDIYPGIHNHAGGQFFRMAKRTQLLFPLNEKKIHWDDYGAHVDRDLFSGGDHVTPNGLFNTKHKSTVKPTPTTPSIADATTPILLPNPVIDPLSAKTWHFDDPEIKTRCITHHLEIPLRCELVFLDYEGKSDGEAMKRIVVGLRPQELILVGSDRQPIDYLAEYCRAISLLRSDLIHTPKSGEVVNCTKEGDIYQARMKDSLVSSLNFTKIRDYELAWVEAIYSSESKARGAQSSPSHQMETSSDEEHEDMRNGSGAHPALTADQLPVLSAPTTSVGSHKTVFVNEPKLSDLKQLLLAQGLMAEFVSGVLVVDNCVAIKRSEAGKLILEGVLSRTYFDVRNVLYQQFAIL
ncbi:unnamed protein product [Calicophoron daubneyi]|uniref:Cleavage and polyadenylation specificity factor subunit 2 n=1 Tax=Calicophoron daubneyi TaxID=300641 RepID=A0AAV2TY71_CALDB